MSDKKLGASNMAEILGVQDYEGKVTVYRKKIGEPVEEDRTPEEIEKLELFEMVRPNLLQMVKKKTGFNVRATSKLRHHPTVACMIGNADGYIYEKDGDSYKKGIVCLYRASNLTKLNYTAWQQRLYACKVKFMHNLACYGYDFGYVGIYVGGEKLELFRYDRDDDMVHMIESEAKHFWGYVERKERPPLDGMKATSEYIKSLYPKATAKKDVSLAPEVYGTILDELLEAKKEEKLIQRRIAEKQNKLKDVIQDAEIAMIGERKIRWSNVSTSRVDITRLKEEQPDIYEKYVVFSDSRPFKIV